jgi:PAN domain
VAGLTTPPSCPTSHNTNYTTTNGIYLITCSTNHLGSNIRGTGKVTTSFQACLYQCSTNPNCKALSYLPKSGKCYLKSAIGPAAVQNIAWGAVFVGNQIVPSSTLDTLSASSIYVSTSSSVAPFATASSSYSFNSQLSTAPTQISSSVSSSSAMQTSTLSKSSALPPPAAASSQSTATGVESTFTGPTILPAAAHAVLGPIAPFDTDMASMDVIAPAVSAGLFYGGSSNATNSTGNSTAPETVAKLSLTFQYPSVVLDHSIFITASCSGGVLTALFSTSQSFAQAQSTWPVGKSFLLITGDPSCGDGTQNSFFLATSVTFSAGSKTASALGSIVDLVDIFEDMGLDFGTVHSNGTSGSNSTAAPYVCGSPGNSTIDGLPTAPCGTNFDQALNNQLGYYSGAEADLQVKPPISLRSCP